MNLKIEQQQKIRYKKITEQILLDVKNEYVSLQKKKIWKKSKIYLKRYNNI